MNETNRYREEMMKLFMQKWKQEYLLELQNYHISMQRAQAVEIEPAIGEVVIMKEDSPRSTWKLARVEEIHRGRDGMLRSVEIRKSNGEKARRPPQLLIPLECKIYKKNE